MDVDLSLLTGNKGHKCARKVNELELYYDALAEDLAKLDPKDKDPLINNPLDWWHQVGCKEYPTLFKIALDFLSIPCTLCDCERAFSTVGRTITNDRNQLGGETIEALQLQKNWLHNKVVKSYLGDLEAVIKGLEKTAKEAIKIDD